MHRATCSACTASNVTARTSRTLVDKHACPSAVRIAARCFPIWQGSHIVIVEADPKWCFRPVANDETIEFTGTLVTDYANFLDTAATPIRITLPPTTVWGTAVWGVDSWPVPSNTTEYFTARMAGLQGAQGKTLQLGLTETSIYPWTVLGMTGEYDNRGVQ